MKASLAPGRADLNRPYILLCAVALIVGGPLLVIGSGADALVGDEDTPLSETSQEAYWIPLNSLRLVFAILLLLGMPGLYLAQAARVGAWGLALHVYATTAVALMVGLIAIVTVVAPTLAPIAPEFLDMEDPPAPLGPFFAVAWIGTSLAFVLIGVLNVVTDALSRWAGALLIVGTVLTFVLEAFFFVGDAAVGAGFAWLGVAVWRKARIATTETPDSALGEPSRLA